MSLGAKEIVAMDVSELSVKYLKEKYSSDSRVTIYHGNASTIIKTLDSNFDLVNSIGVMFHIIDYVEWIETINAISKSLRNTGLLVIGGNFGWFDGINVKIDKAGNICKRLRSLRRWKRELKRVGFSKTHLYRNNAYLWINDPLPENSVLISEMGKISNEFGP